ncbi:Aste57867_18086 [Aphanomyces stellatus]|uniref:Aste57867_18086 protein n=1 Tax=Aphanomyces stellatus TaxID=120398 RepID=A0A485LAW1_9STRA|nr:hypothetical protein As57867_018024 [Aphanomyces stellatus]VFT94825.1 Aste57867_18086 [Aphanomyces stellatus]
MPAFCPRCGDLLKGVDVCGKCQLQAVTSDVNSVLHAAIEKEHALHSTVSPRAGGRVKSPSKKTELTPLEPVILSAPSPPLAQSIASPSSPMVRKLKKCIVCAETIVGPKRTRGDDFFHDCCLTCHRCRKPIDEDQPLHILYETAYHESCAVDLRVCHSCHDTIVGKGTKVADQLWYHKKCLRCFVCKSDVDANSGAVRDDKAVCGACANGETRPSESLAVAASDVNITAMTDDGLATPGDDDDDDSQLDTPLAHETNQLAEPSFTWSSPLAEDTPTTVALEPAAAIVPLALGVDISPEANKMQPSVSPEIEARAPTDPATDANNTVFVCVKCQESISDAAIEALGQYYHSQCFLCAVCEKPIDETFVEAEKKVYHQACYNLGFGRQCTACNKVLEDTAVQGPNARLYHAACFRCTSCVTPLTIEAGYFVAPNNEPACRECTFNALTARCTSSKATATHTFTAMDASQVSVAAGDDVALYLADAQRDDDDGWCVARVADTLGFVPRSYLAT